MGAGQPETKRCPRAGPERTKPHFHPQVYVLPRTVSRLIRSAVRRPRRNHAQDCPVLGQTKTIAVLEIDRDAKEGGGDIGSTGGVGVLRLR
jgi:hypothetical protein